MKSYIVIKNGNQEGELMANNLREAKSIVKATYGEEREVHQVSNGRQKTRKIVDLRKYGAGIFWQYIYPAFAKQFLTYTKYEDYIKLVQSLFILNEKQYGHILCEWQTKEDLLNND